MASYTAIAAKVRAMYGCRMTPEDYRQLMSKQSISEAASFLQSHPGYRRELSGMNVSGIHREQLETALRSTYRNEYRRIFRFLTGEDQAFLRFPIYRAEKEAILTAMRRLSSQHMLEPEETWAPMLAAKSKLHLTELRQAGDFRRIADAARDTIYASALSRSISADGREPSMAFVDNILLVTYYAHLYRVLAHNYAGDTKKLIKKSLDEETDLLNLVLFLRLLSAEDYDAALELVRSGPYGALFRSIQPTGLEAYLYTMQYRFNLRQLRAAQPTVYTPVAYLGLKEIELRNIISIIECIRYGVSPERYITLIGAE